MSYLWRVSNHCDLTGVGGERADGRWHTASRGKRIVYLSEHPAVALIETLVNLKGNPDRFPEKYQLVQVEVDAGVMAAKTVIVDEDGKAPHAKPLHWTQAEGDAWLKSARSVLAVVPAIPAPRSLNYLLNPLHPDAARTKVVDCAWLEYDRRLFKIRE